MNRWLEEREFLKNWRHIQIVLKGEKDICRCTVCGSSAELEITGRKRSSVLLETARKHFYGCVKQFGKTLALTEIEEQK